MMETACESAEVVESLREHQARFACHVCGKASAGPYCASEGEPLPGTCDWDMSRDLIRCEVCQRWCCEAHIRNFSYDVWWACIVCFLEHSARIAQEAGDAADSR